MILSKRAERARNGGENGELANLIEGDYVLVSCEGFHEREKFGLRWLGPRWMVKAVNDYVVAVEDLRNDDYDDVHSTSLKFYSDASLEKCFCTMCSHGRLVRPFLASYFYTKNTKLIALSFFVVNASHPTRTQWNR